MKKLLPLSLLFLGIMGGAKAQTCGTTISTFPYVENFDGAGPTGWVSGGTASSWALGTPTKTVINSAASGTKSWVTSLNGLYNFSENSYVESPCFNMSSLLQPVVELKVWWNSEFSWDGAVLQSSIDNGATWQVVGAKGDPNNWYNDNSINGAPGGQPAATAVGWTGRNLSSNGSGGWVTAKHELTGLAGKPNVKLRIAFGSDVLVVDEGFAFDNFTVYDTPANDASLTSITSPGTPVVPGTPQPVMVTVKNLGTSPLTSATLGYSVNKVAQPTFAWAGNLAPNATSTPVQIGTFSFPTGVQKIKAWSKLPNAAPDGNPGNDSTEITINSCNPLAGNYTVNKGAPLSATNFTSLNMVAQLLGTCGVSGPVTVTVAPNSGTYNEQVIIPAIPGTSATNTVTFEGNGNTVFATIASSSTMPGVITINGADYLRLNNFKVEPDATTAAGWGIQLMNASDNNTITNCTINIPLTNTGSLMNGIVAGTSSVTGAGNYANNLLLQNNTVNGGYYGIVLNGVASGTLTNGNRIINNTVKDATAYSIYLSNAGNTLVEGNDISRPNRVSVSTFYGIYLGGTNKSTIISKNRIHNTHDAASITNGSVYGIYTASAGAAGSENIIKNNVIYNVNCIGGTFYAFYNGGGHFTHYYHNSVSADNPAISYASLRGFYILAGVNNLKSHNNIISLSSPATAKHGIYIASSTVSLLSNYNDIYLGSTGNFGYYAADIPTLAAWQAISGTTFDQNSISTDPQFVSASYLQPLAPAVDNKGTPITGITDDINGTTRSTTIPDMGAFEFTPAALDAGITAITSPTSPINPGSRPVTVTLKNFGTTALTSATISWSVNGVAQPNYAWTGNLATLTATATPVTIGSFNFVGGNYTVKVWSKNPNGGADALAVNDTTNLKAFSCAPLAGAYTVNKNNPTAGTNFQSLSEIAQRLTTCGVSAPVTVTVTAATGPYNEQVEFGNIPFTSATNTITFEGSGNTVSAMPGAKPGIFVLNGTDHVKLNNFVITFPATATAAWGVQLMNAADYNTISNSTINIPLSITSSGFNGIGTGTSAGLAANNASNLKILNNTINGGYYGINLSGNTGGINGDGYQIVNNQLKDQFAVGIQVNHANGALIENNDISRPTRTTLATMNAIMLSGTSLNAVISKNRIHNTHDAAISNTTGVYGIYITAAATVGNENIIKNNLIYNINSTNGALYGFYVSNGNGSHFYHNTLATDPAASYVTLRGLFVTNNVTNVKFVNNNISIPSSGTTKHAIYIGSTIASVISNNNNFYVGTLGNIGYFSSDKVTLADWKAANANAYDQASIAADPQFVNAATANFKPTTVALDNVGQTTPVTDDIMGAARNTATPDMGAYEFGVPANDVAISAISVPNNTGCGLTNAEVVTVTIRNFGSNTQTSIPVTYTLNGTGLVSETWTGSLAPNATATYAFTVPANFTTVGNHRIIATANLAGDINLTNNTDTLDVVNAMLAGIPGPFNFETAAAGIASFKLETNLRSAITEGTAASLPFNGQPATSTKGMIMEGTNATGWVMPVGLTDPWTSNPDHLAGAYFCFSPAGGNPTDPLWLSFDLKQLFKTANANTNFRVTVNGVQVGTTYRPPFTGTPIDWQKVYIDLSAYKTLPTIRVGLESSVAEAYANGAGTANLVDNIRIQRLDPTGVKDNLLAAQLHVFPNPSTGNFMVSLPKGKTYQLEVTDLTGKHVMNLQSKGDAQLNLEHAAKGIYLLKVSGENGTAVRKLIIE